MSKGLKIGFRAVWGLQLGFVLQVIAAACGVSVLIIKSSFLFTTLKYIGAIYLIYLGVSLLFKKEETAPQKYSFFKKGNSPFIEGILINLLNPKIAVFFISYIPQFINENGISPVSQLMVLGLVFCLIGTITTIGYAVTAKHIANKWNKPKVGSFIKKWVPGTIFLAFGLKLAVIEK